MPVSDWLFRWLALQASPYLLCHPPFFKWLGSLARKEVSCLGMAMPVVKSTRDVPMRTRDLLKSSKSQVTSEHVAAILMLMRDGYPVLFV